MSDFPKMPRYDLGDPDQVALAEQADELRELENHEMLRQLLQTYEGRALVWQVWQEAGMGSSAYCGEQTHDTAHLLGRRSIGEWLESFVLTVASEQYNIIRREAVDREQRYAAEVGGIT